MPPMYTDKQNGSSHRLFSSARLGDSQTEATVSLSGHCSDGSELEAEGPVNPNPAFTPFSPSKNTTLMAVVAKQLCRRRE